MILSSPTSSIGRTAVALVLTAITLSTQAASLTETTTNRTQRVQALALQRASVAPLSQGYSHKPWDWKKIELEITDYPASHADFPPDFLWGAGTSGYQVEGGSTNSTYTNWEQKNPNYVPSGTACDHWNRYKDDIKLMKNELGLNAYRFSLEWSKIQPKQGVFDEQAINHYALVCQELINHNIRPVIGFHHYSDPQWFMDLGGFEKSKNIRFFVEFCTKMHAELSRRCSFATQKSSLQPLWLTFNSPASYAANGYLTGNRPPGIRDDFKKMALVLKNMLEAHVRVYQDIKKQPQGEQAQIGITHNIMQLDPVNPYNPLQRIKCYYADVLVHTCVYNFFTTGSFSLHLPFKVLLNHTNALAPKSLDFIGLNYYSHCYMGTSGGPQRPSDELPTDNPQYSIYGEGLYRALQEVSTSLAQPCGIPIYVTENGVGSSDESTRLIFLKRYLYALSQAIKDGLPVKGYIHWSFMDNFEWGSYAINYGLYQVDRTTRNAAGDPTLERTLRPSSTYFIDIIRGHA